VSIHPEHPFLPPEDERDPVRRLRGRLGGTVTLWAAGEAAARAGLTVSSRMVAAGEPAHALALLDPDSDLAQALRASQRCVLQLLEWRHRDVADAFAGAPAPGGPFTRGTWEQTDWGPRLLDAPAWAGGRLADAREVGWSLLVDVVLETVEVGEEADPLEHRRGRYLHRSGGAAR
jgi:flavin reductase (DIM6/NTAB) family NADH-FMN oxidoreductase RutF